MRNFRFLLLLCAGLIGARPASAQDRQNVERLGGLYNFWSESYELVVRDNLAYVAAGNNGLQIVDVSDADNPVVVGAYTENADFVSRVVVEGNFAYTVEPLWGVRIINIEDPANPRFVGGFEIGEFRVQQIAVSGDHIYVAVGGVWIGHLENGWFEIVDISDRANPQVVSQYFPPDPDPPQGHVQGVFGVAVDGDFAFIYDARGKVIALNVANPQQPEAVAIFQAESDIFELREHDQRVYCTDARGYLLILGFTNNNQLSQLALHSTQNRMKDFVLSGDMLYYAQERSALIQAIDISNPNDIQAIGELQVASAPEHFAIEGDRLYTTPNGLQIIELHDNGEMQTLNSFNPAGYLIGVKLLNDNTAIVIDYHFGLRFVDVTDPQNPAELSALAINEPYGIKNFVVTGNIVILQGQSGTLRVIDAADPANPSEVGMIGNLYDYDNAMAFNNGFIYLGGYNGVQVVDVRDPAQPAVFAHFDVQHAQVMTSSEDRIYILDQRGSVTIYNVANLERMDVVGSVAYEAFQVRSITVANGYLYIPKSRTTADGVYRDGTVQVVDIRDEANPQTVCEFTPSHPSGEEIVIAGDYALIAGGNSGFCVANIVDPAEPIETGYFVTSGYASGLAHAGDNPVVLVADVSNLGVYDYSAALNLELAPVWVDVPDSAIIGQEGEAISFQLQAVERNRSNMTITFQRGNLPEDVNFTDNGDGSCDFSWQPNFTQAGAYRCRFIVSDGALTDSALVAVKVAAVNAPPEWVESPTDTLTIGAGAVVEFSLKATDPNGTTPFLTMIGVDLPDSARFVDNSDGTGRFVWQTQTGDTGSFHPVFMASDNHFRDTTAVIIMVEPANGNLEVSRSSGPFTFCLNPSFPNPFNSTTRIGYSLASDAKVKLGVYDLAGRQVALLFEGPQVAGMHNVIWNSDGVSTGVYILRLASAGQVRTTKLVLVK